MHHRSVCYCFCLCQINLILFVCAQQDFLKAKWNRNYTKQTMKGLFNVGWTAFICQSIDLKYQGQYWFNNGNWSNLNQIHMNQDDTHTTDSTLFLRCRARMSRSSSGVTLWPISGQQPVYVTQKYWISSHGTSTEVRLKKKPQFGNGNAKKGRSRQNELARGHMRATRWIRPIAVAVPAFFPALIGGGSSSPHCNITMLCVGVWKA